MRKTKVIRHVRRTRKGRVQVKRHLRRVNPRTNRSMGMTPEEFGYYKKHYDKIEPGVIVKTKDGLAILTTLKKTESPERIKELQSLYTPESELQILPWDEEENLLVTTPKPKEREIYHGFKGTLLGAEAFNKILNQKYKDLPKKTLKRNFKAFSDDPDKDWLLGQMKALQEEKKRKREEEERKKREAFDLQFPGEDKKILDIAYDANEKDINFLKEGLEELKKKGIEPTLENYRKLNDFFHILHTQSKSLVSEARLEEAKEFSNKYRPGIKFEDLWDDYRKAYEEVRTGNVKVDISREELKNLVTEATGLHAKSIAGLNEQEKQRLRDITDMLKKRRKN